MCDSDGLWLSQVIHMIFSWMLCRVYIFQLRRGLEGRCGNFKNLRMLRPCQGKPWDWHNKRGGSCLFRSALHFLWRWATYP